MSKHPTLLPWVVTWTIELDATNAREAARAALEVQRDVGSHATVFVVMDPETGKEFTINLDKEGL